MKEQFKLSVLNSQNEIEKELIFSDLRNAIKKSNKLLSIDSPYRINTIVIEKWIIDQIWESLIIFHGRHAAPQISPRAWKQKEEIEELIYE
tara:strand:- start:2 stop:274 length:273 start_codon:yes stop_codon:yes gene_type:complete